VPLDDENKKKRPVRKAVKPKGPPKILVKGCAFGDLDGKLFYTAASTRAGGKGYIFRWVVNPKSPNSYLCKDRVPCSDSAVNAMSLSQDGGLLVLGCVDGSVTLWSTQDWKPLKVFINVHGFMATCAAARPFPLRLQGEVDGVQIHARTASADGIIACLTLQKNAPTSDNNGDGMLTVFVHRFLLLMMLLFTFSPIMQEAKLKCWHNSDRKGLGLCIYEEVLIAPTWRAGIVSPPY